MKKFWIQVVGLTSIFFIALWFYANHTALLNQIPTQNQPSATPSDQNQLKILDTVTNPNGAIIKAQISIELADTKEKRNLGLGGRESLATDAGMLFVYDNTDKHTFWMKGMRFPLDFIWINENRIVDLLPNIPNPTKDQSDDSLTRYQSTVVVNKVLEVNAGFIKNHNIRVGDKIE